jgi:amino acid adenylation domain-containing protein
MNASGAPHSPMVESSGNAKGGAFDRVSGDTGGADRIPPQPPGARLPLSYSQQRIWFMGQLKPGSIEYNRNFALRLSGPLDLDVLQNGLNEIVRRHAVLRTTFPVVEGVPVQQVNQVRSVDLPVLDLSDLAVPDRQPEATRVACQMASRPFDLAHELLIRPQIIRLDRDTHVLSVTTHHISFDGISELLFLRELGACYSASRRGITPKLPDLVIQYADFAVWERARSQRGAFDDHLAYWRKALADLLPPSLPTMEQGSPVVSGRAGRETLELGGHLSERLHDVCQLEGTTPFMMFASTFVLLLQRLTESEDVVIGFPIAGRTRLEVENLIGMFVNTLPLRVDLSRGPTFRDLLRQIRRATLEGLAHQDVPFEILVEEVQPERTLTRPPIFDCLINSHVFHRPDFDFGDLEVEPFPLPELSTPYPLTFYIYPEAARFRLEMAYQTAMFAEGQVRSMLGQVGFLLEQAVADRDRPIAQYSLTDAGSLDLIPDPTLPIPEPDYPDVVSMVSEWVRRDPTAVAVATKGRSYSYAELWGASTRLADGLLERGLHAGEVVAVVGRRSFELVVSMLGVLIAGGVMLLIDPDWPKAQIEALLERGRARLVLPAMGWVTDIEWLKLVSGLTICNPRQEAGVLGADRSEHLPMADRHLPRLSDPAYVFFTSGTTGKPEPIMGCHKGLSHFLTWQRDTFGFGPGDRCAQLAGLSFDAILHDVFLPLASGAVVCLPGASLNPASPEVLSWLEREKITFLHSVPSLVESWLTGGPRRVKLRALRWLFLAGEPLRLSLVQTWRKRFPRAGEIVNLYGPTETTLVKSCYIVPREPLPGIQPLGEPLPQTQLLILNPSQGLCGVGEPGEIVIRTPYRTLGYIMPDSSRASNFIPNPFTNDPHDLLYRTGDRGYYRSDGSVGFLGRIDHQVKIHGTRVEPDGVAAVLSRQPGVLACAVIAVKDERADDRLTAYVVARDRAVTAEVLREGLGRELASAMVPSGFVFLEKLPVNSNGKVDRDALRGLTPMNATPEAGFVPPRDRLERRLVQIWEQLLGVRPIGVRDDFFGKGGHSLLAVRMFVEVEKTTRKKLPVRVIFEAPTIERLAAVIRSQTWAPPDTQLVPIQPEGTRPPVFWVHAAGGHVLSYRRLAHYLKPDQPVYALQGINLEEDRLSEANVEDMAARYTADLQKVQSVGPYFVGGLSFGGLVAWEIAQRLRSQGHTVALLILLDTRGPGYPRLPLLRSLALELRQRIELHGGNISVLEPRQKLAYLFERGRTLLPRLVRRAWTSVQETWYLTTSPAPRAVKRAYRDDIKARARYSPKPYAGAIAFFRAQSQPTASDYPLMGWEGLVKGRMDIYEVPGAHASIMAEPHLQVLATKLNQCLEAAQAGNAASPSKGAA